MRPELLGLLRCPHCAKALAMTEGSSGSGQTQQATLGCENGHRVPVVGGVVQALQGRTPAIDEQLEENARERKGQLDADEKAAYRRNISRIGCATYNQLIRDNAGALLDAVAVAAGHSLDLGGGSGWLAEELARRGLFAVSIDIEDPHERRRQIEEGAVLRDFELVTDVAGPLAADQVDYVVGDMEHLPFHDGGFDVITISAALHHAAEPVRALREAARVLRPGGTLLCINEPVKGRFRDEAPILHGRGDEAGEHLYSASQYVRFFRDAGLEPRLHFPGWVDRRLVRRDWTGVVYYRPLLPVVGALWRQPAVRRLVKGPLLRPAMDLFGLTLIAEARKP